MKASEYIYGMLALAMAILACTSCSDNQDPSYMPTDVPRFLKVDGHEGAFTRDLDATSSEFEMNVESNTLWKVKTESDGGWITVDKTAGRRDEIFTVKVAKNTENASRKGYVRVFMVDAQGNEGDYITVTLEQGVGIARLSPSSVTPFAAQNNEPKKFEVMTNVEWTLDVTYDGAEATKFVTITDTENMTDSGDGAFSGNGNASFYIRVDDNLTIADRKAYINLHSEFGTSTVEISQNKSDYSFEVSPSDAQTIAASGGEIIFGVRSLSGWKVSSEKDWVKFSQDHFSEGSSSSTEIKATIDPNSSGDERTSKISFEPSDKTLKRVEVIVKQQGHDAVFSLRRSDSDGVEIENGAELHYELKSSFNWSIENKNSWIEVKPMNGEASLDQKITVKVDPNDTNRERVGTLTLTPKPTKFPGGITLGPEIFGFKEYEFSIVQSGGKEASLSEPWLSDGYGQTEATVCYSFSSQFNPVKEAGLEWRKESDPDSGWNRTVLVPSNSNGDTVEFHLKGLDPGTKYVARGFVVCSDGAIKYGSVALSFKTTGIPPSEGKYPGIDDNPAP